MPRLPTAPTQRVVRDREVPFNYLGRPMMGLAGDSVATAMYANGVRIFSRSLKYHRPRGLYSLDGESANTLVNIDGVPNESAERTLLRAGMTVTAQNISGSPETDRYAILDRLSGFMPAGFYYHWFHRPYWLWPFFQQRIRAMAGIGRLDIGRVFDDSRRSQLYLRADVAVVGGGTAGMNAALAAARQGLRVCLFEQRPSLGGHLDWRIAAFEGEPLYARARRLAEQVEADERIRVFRHAPVTGVLGNNQVVGFQVGAGVEVFDERYLECRARSVVVATGCDERPLVCNGNDRPGVMQVATALRLARTYGLLPGKRAVFSVGDDLGLEAALDLADLGLDVAAVADARATGHDAKLVAGLRSAGIEFLPGWAASAVHGGKQVVGAKLTSLQGGKPRAFDCDLVVASAGPQAAIGALSTAGVRFEYCETTGLFKARAMPRGLLAAGRLGGLTDPASLEASGHMAGLEAAAGCGRNVVAELTTARNRLASLPGPASGCNLVHGPNLGKGSKAFICLDDDGTYKAAVECASQGFDVPELAKRYGGFGLGPGQHRVPGQNLALTMTEITARPLREATATTVRPPLVPVTLATAVGARHSIYKWSPLQQDQAARGGVFRNLGVWRRARYFNASLDCRAEVRNVRQNVGLLDGASLGKFRLYGPDALKALQRIYISNMEKTRVGRCKYSAMCNEVGNVIDDGVVTRIGEDEFYLTTTSARAGITIEWFRYHTRFENWDYKLVNLTDAQGSINIAGPNARRVLQKITRDDVSNQTLPYVGYREILIGDKVKARCLRLGFVGELSYELHVPASYCQYVCDLLWEAGREFGIQPFGVEAQNCLRAEKGHIIVGTETEQRVTLLDVGMGFLWDSADLTSNKVGAPALRFCQDQPGRMKLVGLRIDGAPVQPLDGDIVVHGETIVGYVCMTRFSETLGWQYGMALVRDSLAAEGGSLTLCQALGKRRVLYGAKVIAPHFYDNTGERLRM